MVKGISSPAPQNMITRLSYLVLGLGIVGLSVLAFAQGTGTAVLKLPQDIEFKGPLTGPPQTVVLYGDRTSARGSRWRPLDRL
jgi:hypothetical protein